MASQEYRGKHSPPGRKKRWGKPIARSYFAANLLFFVPTPLLLDALFKIKDVEPLGMLASLGAYVMLMLSAWILREGLKAEDAYNERKIAKPPAFPRKIAAGILTGLGVMLSVQYGWGQGILAATVFGSLATAAHLGAFGLDPMRKKGMKGVNQFESSRVADVVEKAEKTIEQLHEAASGIGDHTIIRRVESLITTVRDMIKRIEEDPRDLTRARKYMTVYLTGAKDATIKFANLYTKDRSLEIRAYYIGLIDDLENSFNTQYDALLLDDRSDLDIEIEVLQDRLKHEGLKTRI